MRGGKNLAFSEDTCLEKERVRSKVTPTSGTEAHWELEWSGIEAHWELSKRKCGLRLAW